MKDLFPKVFSALPHLLSLKNLKIVSLEFYFALIIACFHHAIVPTEINILLIKDMLTFIAPLTATLFASFFATLAIAISLKYGPKWVTVFDESLMQRVMKTFRALTACIALIAFMYVVIIYKINNTFTPSNTTIPLSVNIYLSVFYLDIVTFLFAYAIATAYMLGWHTVNEAFEHLKD